MLPSFLPLESVCFLKLLDQAKIKILARYKRYRFNYN